MRCVYHILQRSIFEAKARAQDQRTAAASKFIICPFIVIVQFSEASAEQQKRPKKPNPSDGWFLQQVRPVNLPSVLNSIIILFR